MRRLFQTILEEVHSLGHSSISVPALGTGKTKFTEELVANALFDEALKYSKKHKHLLKITTVNFVIFDENKKAIGIFSKKIQEMSIVTSKKKCNVQTLTCHQPIVNERVEKTVQLKVEIVNGNIVHESTEAIAFIVSESIYQGKQTRMIIKFLRSFFQISNFIKVRQIFIFV